MRRSFPGIGFPFAGDVSDWEQTCLFLWSQEFDIVVNGGFHLPTNRLPSTAPAASASLGT